MKWIQLAFNSGRLLVLVRSLISAEDMFPTTFIALSTTATLVSPSLLISWRASVKGRSPLDDYQHCCVCPSSLHLLYTDSTRSSNVQVSKNHGIKFVNRGEAVAVVPQKLHQFQLTQNAHYLISAILGDKYPMNTTSKLFYSFGKVLRFRQRDYRLFFGQTLNFSKSDGFALSGLLCKCSEVIKLTLLRTGEANGDQQIGIKVSIIESATDDCVFRVLAK